MPELGREAGGRPQQGGRRGPHDIESEQSRDGLLDVDDRHLAAPEFLPPRVRRFDRHDIRR